MKSLLRYIAESPCGYLPERSASMEYELVAEMNEVLQKAIATNNEAEVQKVAEQIVKKGELMGPRAAKKTMLAKQVREEIKSGRVSKKTQLALEDSARMAEEMPLG